MNPAPEYALVRCCKNASTVSIPLAPLRELHTALTLVGLLLVSGERHSGS